MFISIDHEFYYTKIDWWDANNFTCAVLTNTILELIINKKPENCLILLIDISHVKNIGDHFEGPINKALEKTTICLIHKKKTFTSDNLAKIKTKITSTHQLHYDVDDKFTYVMHSNDPPDDSKFKINSAIRKLTNRIESQLIKLVRNSYNEFSQPQLLSSTPIIANGEFNAMLFLSDPKHLRFVASGIADKIHEHAESSSSSSITIVAASLRGALIAGAVWRILRDQQVLNIKIHIINHLGPKYDILEDQIGSLRLGDCIYISDFVIAGTEAKTAATYCSIFGGKLSAVFTIGAVSDSNSIFSKTKLYKLIKLSDCINNLSYEIK